MPLDVVVGLAHNAVDGAAWRRTNVHGFDLMLRVLHRDDPLRRSYLQRRWQGHPRGSPRAKAGMLQHLNTGPCPQLYSAADKVDRRRTSRRAGALTGKSLGLRR
jgi:hypothetical protein